MISTGEAMRLKHRSLLRLLAGGFGSRRGRALTLGDAGSLAAQTTEVIELRTTHDALADDGDAVDVRIDRFYQIQAA